MARKAFRVELELPSGVEELHMEAYIEDAVKSMKGMLHPLNPIFHLDRNSVKVRLWDEAGEGKHPIAPSPPDHRGKIPVDWGKVAIQSAHPNNPVGDVEARWTISFINYWGVGANILGSGSNSTAAFRDLINRTEHAHDVKLEWKES